MLIPAKRSKGAEQSVLPDRSSSHDCRHFTFFVAIFAANAKSVFENSELAARCCQNPQARCLRYAGSARFQLRDARKESFQTGSKVMVNRKGQMGASKKAQPEELARISRGHVISSKGYQVKVGDRTLSDKEGGHSFTVDIEHLMGKPNLAVAALPTNWQAPHNKVAIKKEKLSQIRGRISAALAFLSVSGQIVASRANSPGGQRTAETRGTQRGILGWLSQRLSRLCGLLGLCLWLRRGRAAKYSPEFEES